MDSFEIWWKQNEALYSLVGVKKEVAKAIWSDAVNATSERVLKVIEEHT